MTQQWHSFARLSEIASTNDGRNIHFAIETKDGPPLRLEMSYEEIGNVMQYLAYGARDAAEKRAKGLAPTSVSPIPVDGFGLMLGTNSGTSIIVVRLGDFQLGFEAPNDKLQEFASAFTATVNMLASEPLNKQ